MAETAQILVTKESTNHVDETLRHPNGMTNEQIQKMLAGLGSRKNDPEYLKRGEEGVAEYRRALQEELERELAKEGK